MSRTPYRSREDYPGPFRAWHLPQSFVLKEDEVSGVMGEPGRTFTYPSLSEERTSELLAVLREARVKGLACLPVHRVVDAVDRVARRFVDPSDGLRRVALQTMASYGGYSPPMAEAVLDGMARGWTEQNLNGLLESEFHDPGVLDGFKPAAKGQAAKGRKGRALGYPLTFHLGAGTVPGVSTTSVIRALLVKSAVFLKPGLGDLALPVVFARALAEDDPELAASLAVAYWPSQEASRTERVLAEADLVAA